MKCPCCGAELTIVPQVPIPRSNSVPESWRSTVALQCVSDLPLVKSEEENDCA